MINYIQYILYEYNFIISNIIEINLLYVILINIKLKSDINKYKHYVKTLIYNELDTQ